MGSHLKSNPEFKLEVAYGYLKVIHVLFGLYAYEWFLSLDFEWEFVTGKARRKFKWPMIFYFANRYCLLFALIGIMIALNTNTKINCDALYTFSQLIGVVAIGLASINLSVRTIAIWSSNKYIVGGLILAIIGQWALILQGGRLKARWVGSNGLGCEIAKEKDRNILCAIFIYAMCFDLIVLLLTTYKLFVLNSKKLTGQSRITQVIFVDGLMFFIVAFLVNLMAVIFIILDLNSLMSVMFTLPAAVFSSIVACRAVRRLKKSGRILDAEQAVAKAMDGLSRCEHDAQSKVETNIHCDIEYQSQASKKSWSISESDIDVGIIIEETKGRRQELSSPGY